jgi:hypothetical protein
MEEIEDKMIALMEDAITGFTTVSDVTIHGNIMPEESLPGYCRVVDIYVISYYPLFPTEHPTISLELFIEFKTLFGFIEQFNIQNLDDLEKITPERLLDLYHVGKALLFCLSGDKSLCFRKDHGIIYASDHGTNEHPVLRSLVTQDDFIEYTNLAG